MERMIFPYFVYDKDHSIIFPKKLKSGWIYSMGTPDTLIRENGYEKVFKNKNVDDHDVRFF